MPALEVLPAEEVRSPQQGRNHQWRLNGRGHSDWTLRDNRGPERRRFHLAVEAARREQEQKRPCDSEEQPTSAEQAGEYRSAVRQALVELGILTSVWRSITLRIKSRQSAESS